MLHEFVPVCLTTWEVKCIANVNVKLETLEEVKDDNIVTVSAIHQQPIVVMIYFLIK